MPRVIKRRRKRPLIEVGKDTILILIERKTRIIALNKFLGGSQQLYFTLVAGPRSHFYVFHDKPLPFIIQANGILIPDSSLNIESKRNAHYHPS